jgi:hypothetical protein
MSLGGAQVKRGGKKRVYLEQGKQNKMCAFVKDKKKKNKNKEDIVGSQLSL